MMDLPFKPGDRPADVRLWTMGGASHALHDFRGRKTLVFVWASWCSCREKLPLIEKFHRAHPEVNVLSIACDVQGVDHPMAYLRKAEASHELFIDGTCTLGRRWKLKRVGVPILLDENGVVLLTAESLDPKFLAQAAKLLSRKPSRKVPREPKADSRNTQVDILMQACGNFLGRGRKDDAVAALRKALALDPENRVIPKQIWAIEHPEKFYTGAIDKDWQHRQPPVM